MAKFVTQRALEDAIYDILYHAKERILILSPYIKLDNYFKNLFERHLSNANVQITIGFGKNTHDPTRSLSVEDFDFFKKFPNMNIIYFPNLHAKYYANEKQGVLTSINLYDYSFKYNIEYGILFESGLLGIDSMDQKIWNHSIELFKKSYAVFIRKPQFTKGLLGIGKNYTGSITKLDLTKDLIEGKVLPRTSISQFSELDFVNAKKQEPRISRQEFEKKERKNNVSLSEEKLLSATALGSPIGMTYNQVKAKCQKLGYIDGDQVTPDGIKRGLSYMRTKDGKLYIVYPVSLATEIRN